MKELLITTANEARLPLGHPREDILFRLLTISIEEFFDADGNSDGDGSSAKDSVRLPSSRSRTVGSTRKSQDDECRGSK